jgi:Fic/DOC family
MRKWTSSTDGYAARTYLPSFIVGRERFARIGAVEGIALTDEMRETFARFDQQALAQRNVDGPSSVDSRGPAEESMYESGADPYCYPASTVLKIRLGLRDQAELDAFEAIITAQRGEEPLPRGHLGFTHYRAIHRHLFQEVFDWAGRLRTIRIAKAESMFCYPEHIDGEMKKLFAELKAAKFLLDLPL